MIINTGCRTDIPAYYSEWFCNRIKEGYVLSRNPYYPNQVSRYRLSPAVVDCLCFCTKNPEPMLKRLTEVQSFGQFWFVTINPYEKEIEPDVPPKEMVMESLRKLSEAVGINAVGWRYDPIFITGKYSLEFHIESFRQMAKILCGVADNCVISFIDLYKKTRRNFPDARSVTNAERAVIGREFVQIGRQYGISVRTCCEGNDLKPFGVDVSGCMTKPVIERAIGYSLAVTASIKSSRGECDCLLGSDIGMYNTCGHGCIYCYANESRPIVIQNQKCHHPESPFLIGSLQEGDQINAVKQMSFRDGQLRLKL